MATCDICKTVREHELEKVAEELKTKEIIHCCQSCSNQLNKQLEFWRSQVWKRTKQHMLEKMVI